MRCLYITSGFEIRDRASDLDDSMPPMRSKSEPKILEGVAFSVTAPRQVAGNALDEVEHIVELDANEREWGVGVATSQVDAPIHRS